MAILNHFAAACLKNLHGNLLPEKQMFNIVRLLHKSATSECLGVTASEQEAVPQTLMTPADLGLTTRIKTLKEMPGPSTIANLIEFFYRDGFSRIHEIQVKVWRSLFEIEMVFILCICQICHPCVKWHRLLRKNAPGVCSAPETVQKVHIYCVEILKYPLSSSIFEYNSQPFLLFDVLNVSSHSHVVYLTTLDPEK